jgi:hypothetical protein
VRLELEGMEDRFRRHRLLSEKRAWEAEELPPGREPHRIAQESTLLGGFGRRRIADLRHAGYAIWSRADLIVTWDRRTFAHPEVRRAVARWGVLEGRPVPRIGAVPEVKTWLNRPMIWAWPSGRSGRD